MKNWWMCKLNEIPLFGGRSVPRSREARTAASGGFSELNGLFL
jgi:hypothetical protein